ncbi:N-acetylmuramoyl-L-alanine amidase [Desulfothermus okinawensis]
MRRFFLLFFLILYFTSTYISYASTCRTLFLKGYKSFYSLKKDRKRSKYRSKWIRVKDIFYKAYRCNKKGPYAPKALYYIARSYQELGKRSHLKKDFINSIRYFDLLVKRYPSHSWGDDAKLYSAKIKLNRLKDVEDAYIDLLYIENMYPNGDKVEEAKKLLKELDGKYLRKIYPLKTKSNGKKSVKGFDGRKNYLAKVLNIRKWMDKDYARVVADLSHEVSFKRFVLKGIKYSRLVVDLMGAYLPKNLLDKEEIGLNKGFLTKVRFSQYRKNVVRLVLYIRNIKDFKVFTLQNPFRVVVDIYGKKNLENVKLVKDAVKKSTKVSESLIEQLGLDIRTIMIDPGHGGKDPGAIYRGVREKDINLRMAKILGRMLKKKGFKVLYTRTTDKFIPLEERTVMANTRGADLFISLHVNACRNRRVSGIEVYYLNIASSKDAIRVAARENAVSSKKISDLQLILTDLMLNSKIKESSALASKVLNNILLDCRAYHPESNGVRQAPFYVLMGARMPAILIEIGYLTNPVERRRLKSYSYLKRIAKGIVDGVLAYRRDIKKFAGL